MSWAEQALNAVDQLSTARIMRGSFTVEEMRSEVSVEDPPDLRSWGAVVQRAIREKIIEPTGEFRGARSSNASPKPCYRFVPRGYRK